MKYLFSILLFFGLIPCTGRGQNDSVGKADKMRYDSLIVIADSLFYEKDYVMAGMCYVGAHEIDTSAKYPKKQIEKIWGFYIQTKTYNKFEYRHVLDDAESYYYNEDWANAKKKYEEAFAIRPDCDYCRSKIKECEAQLLKKK